MYMGHVYFVIFIYACVCVCACVFTCVYALIFIMHNYIPQYLCINSTASRLSYIYINSAARRLSYPPNTKTAPSTVSIAVAACI